MTATSTTTSTMYLVPTQNNKATPSPTSTASLVDREIGAYGYGLMGLTWREKPCSQAQAFDVMKTALNLGGNFWNGGEFYGPTSRNSLILLNEYFQKHPEDVDKVVLSIKGGQKKDSLVPDGSRENVRRSVLDSLEQLQKDGVKKTIDIFECARVDRNVPIEETIGYLAELVREGKIGGIGLSEVRAETIRRAAKIHPIAAVEVEMNLWQPDILKNGVAATCAELNIPIVAYSPLGRGALTGNKIKKNSDIPEGDFRKHIPRFQDDVLEINNKIVYEAEKIAKRKGITLPQVALAWVRAHSGRTIKDPKQNDKHVTLGEFIPLPGSTTNSRVEENTRPDIVLTDEEFHELSDLVEKFPVVGDRYPEQVSHLSEG